MLSASVSKLSLVSRCQEFSFFLVTRSYARWRPSLFGWRPSLRTSQEATNVKKQCSSIGFHRMWVIWVLKQFVDGVLFPVFRPKAGTLEVTRSRSSTWSMDLQCQSCWIVETIVSPQFYMKEGSFAPLNTSAVAFRSCICCFAFGCSEFSIAEDNDLSRSSGELSQLCCPEDGWLRSSCVGVQQATRVQLGSAIKSTKPLSFFAVFFHEHSSPSQILVRMSSAHDDPLLDLHHALHVRRDPRLSAWRLGCETI